jgi:hypothetical protein
LSCAQVDLEIALAEQIGASSPLAPRLREHLATRADHVVHDGTVHVGAINVELDEAQPLTLDVLGDRCGTLFFGPICRRDRAGDDDGWSRSRAMCSL